MKATGSGYQQQELSVRAGQVGLTVAIDQDALANLTKNLRGARLGLRRVYIAAVNETNEQLANELTNQLSAKVNLDRSEIDKRIVVSRVTEQGDFTKASVTIKSEPVPLKAFNAQQVSTGVRVQIMRSGSSFTVKSAFGPEIRRLGRNAFRRQGKSRLPIKRLRGVRLTKLVARAKILPQIEVYTRVRFARNMERHLVAAVFGGAAA